MQYIIQTCKYVWTYTHNLHILQTMAYGVPETLKGKLCYTNMNCLLNYIFDLLDIKRTKKWNMCHHVFPDKILDNGMSQEIRLWMILAIMESVISTEIILNLSLQDTGFNYFGRTLDKPNMYFKIKVTLNISANSVYRIFAAISGVTTGRRRPRLGEDTTIRTLDV